MSLVHLLKTALNKIAYLTNLFLKLNECLIQGYIECNLYLKNNN